MNRYEEEKRLAAREAVRYVTDGMLLGVGSGSTMRYFVMELGKRVKNGLKVQAVPTSEETRQLCREWKIPLYRESTVPERIDLTVDGADEFDSQLNLIKGGGGDLLWEKIVASASEREIIIVDSRKKVAELGKAFHLPVEVVPYASENVRCALAGKGIPAEIRQNQDGTPFLTDEKNYILDCAAGGIGNAKRLASELDHMTGVVEHGLFINLANLVIEGNDGKVLTYDAVNKVILREVQTKTLNRIMEKIGECREKGEVPVVELDLDLTAFIPQKRTIEGLKHAGTVYGIAEFLDPAFDLLPGYTREAWVNFISRHRLPEKYPDLRWLGEKDGNDGIGSVYSAFHTCFWETKLLHTDTLTKGLPEWVRILQTAGAAVVFVSGRWKEEQFEPTREVLRAGGIGDVPLLIGNPGHDGSNPVSDSEIKAMHQAEIRAKYGVPAVIIDDRMENRDAVIGANPGIEMLSVGCAVPGFTYDQETAGVEWKLSTFENFQEQHSRGNHGTGKQRN